MASTLNFTTKRGDTFKQTDFQININEAPLDLTGAIIKIQLRKEPGGLIAYEPTISILSGIAGTFVLTSKLSTYKRAFINTIFKSLQLTKRLTLG